MTEQAFLGPLHLEKGAHNRGQGMCAMEAAAYLAGEPHSDSPQCVSPVIAAFFRRLNDRMPDAARQALKPYIPQVLHTRGTLEQERQRAWILVDWSIRDRLPWWLERAGFTTDAEALRALPEVTDKVVYEREAKALVLGARKRAADAAAAAAADAAAAAAYAYAYAAAAAAADAAYDAAAAAADAAYAALLATLPALVARLVAVTQTQEPFVPVLCDVR